MPAQPAMGAMEEGALLALVNLGHWQPVAAKALASPGQEWRLGCSRRYSEKRCRRSRNSHHGMGFGGLSQIPTKRRSDVEIHPQIQPDAYIETYCAGFDSIFCLVTSSGVNIGCAKCSLGFCRRR